MNRLVLCLLLAAVACDRQAADTPLVCAHDAACPSGYRCGSAGICIGDVACLSAAGCCLAERCENGLCRRREVCSEAAPCGAPGTICRKRMCVPRACTADEDCPASRPCIMGTCRVRPPCNGHCAKGRACAPLLDRCVALNTALKTVPKSPQLPCAKGSLALLTNELQLFDEGCGDVPQQIACRELPSLPAGQYGMPAVVVPLGSSLAVIARDRTYGDLVLASHARQAPHAFMSIQTLAGIPIGAPVVGDPKGPRGGIAEPGPDVGDAIAAAASSLGAFVVFHDAGDHSLHYLRLAAGAKPDHRHEVLPGGGRALAASADAVGTPWVAAFMDPVVGDAAAGERSVQLLRASTTSPTSAADWSAAKLLGGTLPAVVKSPIGASHRRGIGAHLALGVRGAVATLAAYDPGGGELVVVRGPISGPFTMRRVGSKQVPGGSSDLGRFPSLVLDAEGRATIACQDAEGGRVLLLQEKNPGGELTVRVVDDGLRADGHHRVGADVALVRLTGGGKVIAYQDTRTAQLTVTQVSANGKIGKPIPLKHNSGAGFAAALVAISDKALAVGSARLSFDGKAAVKLSYGFAPIVLGAP